MKNFSPVRAMPIPSSKPAALLLPSLLLALAGQAAAHETVAPAEDRLSISGGFGLMSLHADEPYPAPRLPGVLEAGSPRADERRDGLDYAEIALRARFSDALRGFLKVAHHGGPDSSNHTEEAWLEGHVAPAHDHLATLRVGRQLLPLGLLNPIHTHARDFGISPLAMRGAVNDYWRADGVRSDWNHPAGWSVGLGAWRNQSFPGADAGGFKLLTARAGWKNEAVQIEAGYANVNADGRALVTTGSAGHTHSLPSCTRITTDRVCFDGTAQLLSLAARWAPADSPLWVGAEWWYKREEGRLDSINGAPAYTGKLNGGWVDVGWRLAPGWEVIGRAERLVGRHHLAGVNAGLVATQTGLTDADRNPTSLGAVVKWRPLDGHRITAEWHRERDGTTNNTVYLLRYQFTFAKGLL
jgi:hypothetical protein